MPSPLRVRISKYEFGGNTDIQIIAPWLSPMKSRVLLIEQDLLMVLFLPPDRMTPTFSQASLLPISSAPTSFPWPHHHVCLQPGDHSDDVELWSGFGFRGSSCCIRCNGPPPASAARSSAGPSQPPRQPPGTRWCLLLLFQRLQRDQEHRQGESAGQKPLLEAEGTPTEARVLVLRTFTRQQLIKRCQAI